MEGSKQQSIKLRLVVFIGYSGTPFQGIQFQREEHVKSLQKQLVQKLHGMGLFKTGNYFELVKMCKYSRAARTDKGVHALINGFSCLMTVPRQFLEFTPQQPNENQTQKSNKEKSRPRQNFIVKKQALASAMQQLFSNIQIYKVCEVGGMFEIRTSVHCRKYTYICPADLFRGKNTVGSSLAETIEKLNRLGKYYIGTHNFHNYSRRIKAKDPAAKRYVKGFNCQQFDASKCLGLKVDQEWLKFTIEGQSFIYHQIRSMIGMLCQVCLNDEPEGLIQNTFFNNIFRIYLAPPQGLYLDSLCFQSYNRKQNIVEKLQLIKQQQLKSIENLRHQLEVEIIKSELESSSFTKWLEEVSRGEVKEDQEDGNNMQIQDS